MKFFIENDCYSSALLIKSAFSGAEIAASPRRADVIVLTGGCDINPRLYGEENYASHCNPSRDVACSMLWRLYGGRLPFFGFCRGAQHIAAMLGGKLMQDIKGHSAGAHAVLASDGIEAVNVNSLHHQAIIKSDCLGDVLHMGPHHFSGLINGIWTDEVNNVESFINKDKKVFGVQWHPEYMNMRWYREDDFYVDSSHKNPAVQWWIKQATEILK